MSSHREAPEISKDPVADSTDVYAFVSPDRPDTVTIIANYIPLEDPAGGPNFFEFGDDVAYRISIANQRTVGPKLSDEGDIFYELRFKTTVSNPNTFLYNTGPITALNAPTFNRRQTYSVTRTVKGEQKTLARGLVCPPCNVGPRSTPNYGRLADAAIYDLPGGAKVFAGQRLDGFWVDLGSIFDLGALRPLQNLHLIPMPAADGINSLQGFSVHSIALQIPISQLTPDGSRPTNVTDPRAVIGVWTSARRQRGQVREADHDVWSGAFTQVSRLGNPLVNEVIIPMSQKDRWNRKSPAGDANFNRYVAQPELAKLLPALYPGAFPNLAGLTADRADLVAVLHTGLPSGVIPGFQNYTGPTQADLLRLNMAVPPSRSPSPLGLLGGDLAGFPNGRRVTDNVVTIELRAVAGATYPLINPSYTVDPAVNAVADGTSPPSFLSRFPYLDHPVSGFDVKPLSA